MSIDWSQMVTAETKQESQVADAKAVIAARRYTEETRGITVNGISINTERDSQNLINGAVVSSLLDPSYTCNWKTPDGFQVLDADTLKAVGVAVRAHVQACFDREAALLDMLERGTYKEYLLDKGWPNVEVPEPAAD